MREMDGSVRIVWTADGFGAIRVMAPHRPGEELDAFAGRVADHALLNRDVQTLTSALRAEFAATFDIDPREHDDPARAQVVISLHPPQGTPNPDE